MIKNLLVALLTLTTSAALAQTAETPPTGTTPPTESAPTQSTESAPAETPAAQPTETPAAPSVDERLTTTEGKVSALEEQNVETKSDLSALKKLKFSGYVQARYQAQQSLDETGTEASTASSSAEAASRPRTRAISPSTCCRSTRRPRAWR